MRIGTFLLVPTLAFAAGCVTEDGTGETEQHTAGAGVASAAIVANAFLGDTEFEVKWNGYESRVEGPTRLVQQEIVINPGGHTGWHTHGGTAFASIVSGELTLFTSSDPCNGTAYPAGTAFVDPGFGHVHIARNLGSTPMTVRVQYILPDGAAVRVDAPAPESCP